MYAGQSDHMTLNNAWQHIRRDRFVFLQLWHFVSLFDLFMTQCASGASHTACEPTCHYVVEMGSHTTTGLRICFCSLCTQKLLQLDDYLDCFVILMIISLQQFFRACSGQKHASQTGRGVRSLSQQRNTHSRRERTSRHVSGNGDCHGVGDAPEVSSYIKPTSVTSDFVASRKGTSNELPLRRQPSPNWQVFLLALSESNDGHGERN